MNLRYTLLADGSSDRVLIPILNWSLAVSGRVGAISQQWADLTGRRIRPRSLGDKIQLAVTLYPCDLLFVHRDAEAESPSQREEEIRLACGEVSAMPLPERVPIVPVRMTEAWLLGSQDAIREAAGNPRGTIQLDLPTINRLEQVADPKAVLFELLKTASELGGRRRAQINVQAMRHRVSETTAEFSHLRALASFTRFESVLMATLDKMIAETAAQ